MSIENLWGDLSDLETVQTPKAILQQQAALLTSATRGVLHGFVTNVETAHLGFEYDLEVVVPALNNYRYELLSIYHGVDIYPTFVRSVHLESASYSAGPVRCENESEFCECIQRILSSKSVRTVLSRLKSQAK